MPKWKIFFLKSDFRFGFYIFLDSTYITYAWTIMIFFLNNAKIGKINLKKFKIRFHIWPIFCFRLHIYYIGVENYDFRDKNVKR